MPARQALAGQVALFGKAWAAVSGFGLVSHVAATLFLGRASEFVEVPFLVHVVSGVVPILVWLLCRVPRSDGFSRVVEGTGLIASTLALALKSSMLADTATSEALGGIVDERVVALLSAATHKRFALVSVFASCMMLTVRSALVPSRMQHTIALGVALEIEPWSAADASTWWTDHRSSL